MRKKEDKRKQIYSVFWDYINELNPSFCLFAPGNPILPFDKPLSFEKWWNLFEKKWKKIETIRKSENRSKGKVVCDYSNVVQEDMKKCLETFKREKANKIIPEKIKAGEIRWTEQDRKNALYGQSVYENELAKIKDPTIEEFMDYFPKYLKGETLAWDRGCFLNLHIKYPSQKAGNALSDSIQKQITKTMKLSIKNRKIDPMVRLILDRAESPNIVRSALIPGMTIQVQYNRPKLRIDEIKRYFDIYKIHKTKKNKLSIPEMVDFAGNKFDTYRAHKSPEHAERLFFIDIKKAEKIMENMKNGVFPGDYQPKTEK